MKQIEQKIVILILVILHFSCRTSQDEGQQQPSVSEPDVAIWTQLTTNSPSMHAHNAMAYDTLNNKIINYGGRSGFSRLY